MKEFRTERLLNGKGNKAMLLEILGAQGARVELLGRFDSCLTAPVNHRSPPDRARFLTF